MAATVIIVLIQKEHTETLQAVCTEKLVENTSRLGEVAGQGAK